MHIWGETLAFFARSCVPYAQRVTRLVGGEKSPVWGEAYLVALMLDQSSAAENRFMPDWPSHTLMCGILLQPFFVQGPSPIVRSADPSGEKAAYGGSSRVD